MSNITRHLVLIIVKMEPSLLPFLVYLPSSLLERKYSYFFSTNPTIIFSYLLLVASFQMLTSKTLVCAS